jgi:hypothetical protein
VKNSTSINASNRQPAATHTTSAETASSEEPGVTEETGGMTKQDFWALIDQSRRATDGIDEQLNKLRNMLGLLKEEELVAFERQFQEMVRDAYRWDLWAAAYIINGGCSDDGFDYFLGWLISQGQRYFEAALDDPGKAGDKAEPGDYVECEEIWYVAVEAYEQLTGKDDFYERAPGVPRQIQGDEWNEYRVHELFPRLAKKFKFEDSGSASLKDTPIVMAEVQKSLAFATRTIKAGQPISPEDFEIRCVPASSAPASGELYIAIQGAVAKVNINQGAPIKRSDIDISGSPEHRST